MNHSLVKHETFPINVPINKPYHFTIRPFNNHFILNHPAKYKELKSPIRIILKTFSIRYLNVEPWYNIISQIQYYIHSQFAPLLLRYWDGTRFLAERIKINRLFAFINRVQKNFPSLTKNKTDRYYHFLYRSWCNKTSFLTHSWRW